MNKKQLIRIIEKYYLGGLTEKVRLKIKDNLLKINFSTELRDCIGELNTPWELSDVELGIYDTTALYKLLKITNDPLTLDIVEKEGKALKLDIKDSQFDLSYNLGDLGLISEGKLNAAMPEPSVTLKLNQEFINKFKQAHGALDKVEVFSIQPKKNQLEFVIGLQERYANKISFSQPTELYNDLQKFVFRVSNFREILNCNSGSEITMHVYSMGIISLVTNEDNIKVQYYLVPQK